MSAGCIQIRCSRVRRKQWSFCNAWTWIKANILLLWNHRHSSHETNTSHIWKWYDWCPWRKSWIVFRILILRNGFWYFEFSQSFSERRSNERRSERALIIDERDLFLGMRARAGAHRKNDERERKLALIFCAHQWLDSTNFHWEKNLLIFKICLLK